MQVRCHILQVLRQIHHITELLVSIWLNRFWAGESGSAKSTGDCISRIKISMKLISCSIVTNWLEEEWIGTFQDQFHNRIGCFLLYGLKSGKLWSWCKDCVINQDRVIKFSESETLTTKDFLPWFFRLDTNKRKNYSAVCWRGRCIKCWSKLLLAKIVHSVHYNTSYYKNFRRYSVNWCTECRERHSVSSSMSRTRFCCSGLLEARINMLTISLYPKKTVRVA